MVCPSCGIDDERVYIGLQKVDCPNRKCVEYESSLDTGVSKDVKVTETAAPQTVEDEVREALMQYLDQRGWP